MATDTQQTHPTEPKSGASGCLKGCLIVFFVLLILGAVGVWWVSQNWRGLVSGMAANGVNEMINQSELPDAEKEELKAEVKRVTDAIADGTMSQDQLQQFLNEFGKSPLVSLLIVTAVESQYVKPSGLSDEEKADARDTLDRYAHGLVSKQLDQQDVDLLMPYVATEGQQGKGDWQMKEQISDEELRQFLSAAKDQVEEAEIPAEVPPIDVSEELKKIVDKVLGPAGGPAPTAPADPPAEEQPAEPAEETSGQAA